MSRGCPLEDHSATRKRRDHDRAFALGPAPLSDGPSPSLRQLERAVLPAPRPPWRYARRAGLLQRIALTSPRNFSKLDALTDLNPPEGISPARFFAPSRTRNWIVNTPGNQKKWRKTS